jgi:hypothetical protein
MLKISAVCLERQKCFFPKKIFSKPRVNRYPHQNNQFCLSTQLSVKVLLLMSKKETANIFLDYLNDTCLKKIIANIQNLISDMVTW